MRVYNHPAGSHDFLHGGKDFPGGHGQLLGSNPPDPSGPRPRASWPQAWASCHDLALIEVWRGLRDDYTWALKSHFVWKKSQKILGGWGPFSKGLGIVSTFFGLLAAFLAATLERILLLGWDLFFFETF